MGTSGDNLLEIRNLRVSYQTYGGRLKVIQDLNMHVRRAEKVGIVGETGCGKTTTMKSILRILPHKISQMDSGQILFNGCDILNMSPSDLHKVRSQGIAMIFQDPTAALNPVFTIGEQIKDVIRFALPINKRSEEKIHKAALHALKEVYLPDQERILGNYPTELSGGMRQRVCIAMAVARSRELIIADEPGTSLDVTIQDQILRLLGRIVEQRGSSIILITHSLGVAREMADRIYVMYGGTIAEMAYTADLFSRPLHPYTQGLLACVPKISGGGIGHGIDGRIPDYLSPPSGCRFAPRCDKATSRCHEVPPSLYDAGEGHQVACFLYGR